jgi:hypothetical protein
MGWRFGQLRTFHQDNGVSRQQVSSGEQQEKIQNKILFISPSSATM